MDQVTLASLWSLIRCSRQPPTQDELVDALTDAQGLFEQHPLREAEIERRRNLILQEQASLQRLEEELLREQEELPEIIEEIQERIDIPVQGQPDDRFDGWKPEPSRIETHPVQQSVMSANDSVNWRFCNANFSVDRETNTIWSENGDFFGEFDGSTKTLQLNQAGMRHLIAEANSVGLTKLCTMVKCMPTVSKTFLINKITDVIGLRRLLPGNTLRVDLTNQTRAELKKMLKQKQQMMGQKQAYLTNGDKRAALRTKFGVE